MAELPEPIEIFPIAIGSYIDPGHADLPNIDAAVNAVVEVFRDFGGSPVAWDTPMSDRGADEVNTRLTVWALSEHPRSIMYWAGHGASTALAHAKSPNPIGSQGITPERLAEAITQHYPEVSFGWAIVIIDACHASRFVQRLSAAIDEQTPVKPLLLVGTAGEGFTNLGRFSKIIQRILRRTFGGDQEISIWDLTRELRRALPLNAEAIPKQIEHAALRRTRPALVGSPVDVIDDVTEAVAELPEDERRHFIPKAQGAELGEQSWYFEGRQTECTRIAAWLRTHRQGLIVVTGPAGSGKSALLGHLIVQSLPALRDVLARHGLTATRPESQRPPDNAFDVVIHLAGLTTTDTLARLALDSGLGPLPQEGGISAQVEWVTQRIGFRTPITMLMDALDESVDPITIASTVLRRLARLPGVRLLVGTRRSTHEGPDKPHSTDRNLLAALRVSDDQIVNVDHDDTAISLYVKARLSAAIQRGQLEADPHRVTQASLLIGASNAQFLFARLAVYEIIANPALLAPTSLAELLAEGHRQLFARAVDRLSAQHPYHLPLLRALAYSRGRGLPVRDGVWATIANAVDWDRRIADSDIDHLITTASPYITVDRDHRQTVYRLAHRTFMEHFTDDTSPSAGDREAHSRIARRLLAHATSCADTHLNPYVRQYLSAHTGIAGRHAWHEVAQSPAVLDRLDPHAVAADAMRTAFGFFTLPPPIAGMVGARHLLATADPSDIHGLRQLAMAQHTPTTYLAHEDTPTDTWSVRWASLVPKPTHLTLTGHNGGVRAIATLPMPDGRLLLASSGADGTIRIWDPLAGAPLGEPMLGHEGTVRAVATLPMPDGRLLLASGGTDGTIRIWDPLAGAPLGEPLAGHKGGVWTIAALPMPDGQLLLASGGTDGTIRIWDVLNHSLVDQSVNAHKGGVRACVTLRAPATPQAPDGNPLLATGGDDGNVIVWEVQPQRAISAYVREHAGTVWALAAIPSSYGETLLASAGTASTVKVQNPFSVDHVANQLTGHVGTVWAACSLPVADGRVFLATSGDDGTVRVWDPHSGAPSSKRSIEQAKNARPLTGLTMPDNEVVLVTGGAFGNLQFWDPLTGDVREDTTLRNAPKPSTTYRRSVSALAGFTFPDGLQILALGGTDGTVRGWQRGTHEPMFEPLTSHIGGVYAIAMLPILRNTIPSIAVASGERTVTLWSSREARTVLGQVSRSSYRKWFSRHRLYGHSGLVRAVAALTMGDGSTLLATGSTDGTARLWDPRNVRYPAVGKPLDGHNGGVWSLTGISLSDGNTLLATGDDDGNLRLWDPIKCKLVDKLANGHNARLATMTTMRDSYHQTLLVTGSEDGTVRLWDLRARRQIHAANLKVPILSLAYLADGLIATGLEDGIAVLSFNRA